VTAPSYIHPDFRRVLAVLAGIAAVILAMVALVNHHNKDAFDWLCGAGIAAGAGLIILCL
jgi:hypothetical protein